MRPPGAGKPARAWDGKHGAAKRPNPPRSQRKPVKLAFSKAEQSELCPEVCVPESWSKPSASA